MIERDALNRLEDWGGPGLVREMIQLYLDNGPERGDQIRDGLAGGDRELVERAAHSLKSSSANVGAMTVSDLSRRIEAAAEHGLMDEAARLDAELQTALAEAVEGLRRIMGEHDRPHEDAS